MFQSQYSEDKQIPQFKLRYSFREEYLITHLRKTIWEEHCLECSPPSCFNTCVYFDQRSDGRCKRFYNGISLNPNKISAEGKSATIKFKRWGNLMTIIYPSKEKVNQTKKKSRLERILKRIESSNMKINIKWLLIRTIEFIRRKINLFSKSSSLIRLNEAFLLHCFNHDKISFNLIMEVHEENSVVYKNSFHIKPGENYFLDESQGLKSKLKKGNLIKIFPENNIEAYLTFFWCHFAEISKKHNDFVKCLVWDLDNTLWDGILVETEDISSLKLRENVKNTIIELDKRGILNSISSKNYSKQALEHLDRLGMKEYFISPQIHWEPKSESVKIIAKEINIGLDSLAFIDDSEFEREEVRRNNPEVRVFHENQITEILDRREFMPIISSTSKNRRLQYAAEEQRSQFKNNLGKNSSISQFIKECKIKINIFSPSKDEEIQRCFELIQRSNQLNLTGRKYSRKEFDEILSNTDYIKIAFSSADKFGEYGIVCFCVLQLAHNNLKFIEYAMSCRIASKHIENAFFTYLLKKFNATKYNFEISKTKKNQLLIDTMIKMNCIIINDNKEKILFDFNIKIPFSNDVEIIDNLRE